MADDLADYPIVVLENDYPEEVGKLGLFDIQMPIGATGIIFVAAVPGILYVWGPKFAPNVRKAAMLRAASTLVQMGLVKGDTFAFLRSALELTQQEIAGILGVALATIQAWETDTEEIPRLSWKHISNLVMREDGRLLPVSLACPPNYRPRRIRVFPNIPLKSGQNLTSGVGEGGNDCNNQVVLPGSECDPPVC